MVGVRIYLRATDMDHILQTQVCRGTRREIDLDVVRKQLGLKGDCLVSEHTDSQITMSSLHHDIGN